MITNKEDIDRVEKAKEDIRQLSKTQSTIFESLANLPVDMDFLWDYIFNSDEDGDEDAPGVYAQFIRSKIYASN